MKSKQQFSLISKCRRQAELDMVADDCIGLKPFVLPLDVLDFEAQSTAYKIIIQKFGHIDILILNAGRSQRALYEDFPIDKTKEIFDLNVMSVINLAQIVLPSMVTSNSGQVIIIND
jgi:dehydrogenase/reductase SDR family protein 7